VPSEMKAMTSSVSSFTRPRLVFGVPLVVPAFEPGLQLVYAERGDRRRQAQAGHEEGVHGCRPISLVCIYLTTQAYESFTPTRTRN
jgi:hypothetical protein